MQLCLICDPVYCSERCLCHVTEELFSLTFALEFCFVPDGSSRADTAVSHSGGHLPQKSTALKVLQNMFPLVTMQLQWKGWVWVFAHGPPRGGGCVW